MCVCMLTFLPQLILTHGDSIPLSCQQHYLQGKWVLRLIGVCYGATGTWWSHVFITAMLCERDKTNTLVHEQSVNMNWEIRFNVVFHLHLESSIPYIVNYFHPLY